MNRPDKAGEPSMEEILASIRQIIADEPSSDQPEPAIEPNPLVPQSSPAPTADEARTPLSDRLSSVLKSGALPPTSPLGSKRPLSFDQDLADMFDEPANGSQVAAPKPDIRVPPGLSHPMARRSFVPEPPHAKEDGAKPLADGAAALPPQLAPSEPLVPPPPFGGPEKPAEAPLPPPKTFGFPPLRKTSFYPPQPKAPAAPAHPSPQAGPSADAPVATSRPAEAGTERAAPAGADPASHRLGDMGSAPPAETASAFAGPMLGAPPSVGGGPSPVEAVAPEASPSAFAPSSAVPSSVSAAPAQPERGGFAPAASPFAGSPPSYGAAAPPRDPIPVEPEPFAEPFAASPPPSSGFSGQSRFAADPDTSSVAAHQALDALAQGLAASAASAASAAPEAQPAAIPLTPVIEPEPSVHSAPGPSTLPAPLPPAGSGSGRTLEDAVADMLRPMLQQWVADNMPRIIERALRTEVATSTRPGQKPPGT